MLKVQKNLIKENSEANLTEGESDLRRLLVEMNPILLPNRYRFVSISTCTFSKHFETAEVFAFIREEEGLAAVMESNIAEQFLQNERTARASDAFCAIKLSVHSSLNAVGLTAAVSAALAEAGIPANIISGFYHDYIFIPENDADRALETLTKL